VQPIFHIAEWDAWVESVTRGRYAAPSLASEGFIHCSTRDQVLATANRYYRGRSGLMLLCIDPSRLVSRLEYEAPAATGPLPRDPAREGLFPHIYGPIDVHALTRVVEFGPDANGQFDWPANIDPRPMVGAGPTHFPGDNLVSKNLDIERFWTRFCEQARTPTTTPYQAWYFGDSRDLAHELVELVVHGAKRATTSLLWSIQRRPELAAIPGAYSVVTELNAEPRAVIRTTRIDVRAFDAVDAELAWEEGEDDRSLEAWRAAHLDYFSR